jgi:hypothetical protein
MKMMPVLVMMTVLMFRFEMSVQVKMLFAEQQKGAGLMRDVDPGLGGNLLGSTKV